MGNTYEEFAARLRASIPGVLAIAGWLYRHEWSVHLPALILRPKHESYKKYQDEGDLFAEKDGKRLRFEVKYMQRHSFFNNIDSWPYEDFFIADRNAVDRANGGVAAYFWVSKDLEYAAFVRQETRPHWKSIVRYMRNTDKQQAIYVCPLEFVEFVRIRG